MELICHISLAEPDLLLSTAEEYAAEIEAAASHCYQCGEEFCDKHGKLADDRMKDLAALTTAMLKMELR